MKYDIILAGVGGQGVLLVAELIAQVAFERGLHIKEAETHGMAQRGGAVMTHLRVADQPIFSPLVPKGQATLLLGLEPVESLRYVDYLAADGWLMTSLSPMRDIPGHPDDQALQSMLERIPRARVRVLDAAALARAAGVAQASNLVMLGFATSILPFLDIDALKGAIERRFAGATPQLLAREMAALEAGIQAFAASGASA